jgi:hypothetical protein
MTYNKSIKHSVPIQKVIIYLSRKTSGKISLDGNLKKKKKFTYGLQGQERRPGPPF